MGLVIWDRLCLKLVIARSETLKEIGGLKKNGLQSTKKMGPSIKLKTEAGGAHVQKENKAVEAPLTSDQI